MRVSVIVPNHNRDISKLEDSLKKSTYLDWELLHINRGLERSEQRNIGINEANGDAFLILDSDQSVSPCLIKECVKLAKQGFSAVFIPEVIIADSFFGKIRNFERSFMNGTHVDVPRFVIKKACPLFDLTMSGPEDADWGQRIPGLKTISENVMYHHDDISFIEYCRKKAYYTKSMKRYIAKWPKDPCINLKYRCWTIFTENGKWKRLLKHPILTLGIVFLLITRGVIFYANK